MSKGKSYTQPEIDLLMFCYLLMYAAEVIDTKKIAAFKDFIGLTLSRSRGAIDMIFRQIKKKKVIGNDPKKAKNQIQRQVLVAKESFAERIKSEKNMVRCMYCGKLPLGAVHYRCSECDSTACTECIVSDDGEFLCEECAKEMNHSVR